MPAEPFDALARHRLIPVVVLEDAAHAAPLAEALVAGGLPCAEVTFRTPAALEAIRAMAARGDMLVGAGTVLTVAQVRDATAAGARFVVSPGLDPAVVEFCQRRGVPVIPGVATPTDLTRAVALGLGVVKFFPAEAFGGRATLRALAGPFPDLRFVPTGGVSPDNLPDYLRMPEVLACGGSWLTAPRLYAGGDYSEVTRVTAAAVRIVAGSERG